MLYVVGRAPLIPGSSRNPRAAFGALVLNSSAFPRAPSFFRGGVCRKTVRLLGRALDTAFNNSLADGVAGEGGGVVDIEFTHEVGAVLFDGLDADTEYSGAFLIGLALRDQLQDLGLARGQGFPLVRCLSRAKLRLRITVALEDGRAEEPPPRVDFANGVGQGATRGLFQHEAPAPDSMAPST